MTEQEMIELADAELWCQSFSGREMHPCALDPKDVRITDIAHALSMQCRFGGHCLRFYSVAQHSLHVASIVEAAGLGPKTSLQALLHDMTEAVLIDVPRPAKCSSFLAGYRTLEKRIAAVMFPRFGLSADLSEEIKIADEIMLATERAQLMRPSRRSWELRFEPIEMVLEQDEPLKFKQPFLDRFTKYTAEIAELGEGP